jgi:hypothetical protein
MTRALRETLARLARFRPILRRRYQSKLPANFSGNFPRYEASIAVVGMGLADASIQSNMRSFHFLNYLSCVVFTTQRESVPTLDCIDADAGASNRWRL